LAGSLLESLDETVDDGAEAAWQREIAGRIQELDSGKVRPVAWAEARQQISGIIKWPVNRSKSILLRSQNLSSPPAAERNRRSGICR
jgi:hypothetical protein